MWCRMIHLIMLRKFSVDAIMQLYSVHLWNECRQNQDTNVNVCIQYNTNVLMSTSFSCAAVPRCSRKPWNLHECIWWMQAAIALHLVSVTTISSGLWVPSVLVPIAGHHWRGVYVPDVWRMAYEICTNSEETVGEGRGVPPHEPMKHSTLFQKIFPNNPNPPKKTYLYSPKFLMTFF